MTNSPNIDWEDAFTNADYIPNGNQFLEDWPKRAEAFRRNHPDSETLTYGNHPRESLDLFRPKGTPRGLAVFVHGGYWLRFDKSDWSDLAQGALEHGWAVAMPSYTLAPEATIPSITLQIGAAIHRAASEIEGPIRLAGHSAGGHLAARMVNEGGPLPSAVSERVERVVSISGVHDLRPLLLHSMNDTLKLTEETATTESPVLNAPLSHVRVTAWVGARERPEFLRQSALLAEAWDAELIAEPKRHHFDVIDGLKDPDHALCDAFAGS